MVQTILGMSAQVWLACMPVAVAQRAKVSPGERRQIWERRVARSPRWGSVARSGRESGSASKAQAARSNSTALRVV